MRYVPAVLISLAAAVTFAATFLPWGYLNIRVSDMPFYGWDSVVTYFGVRLPSWLALVAVGMAALAAWLCVGRGRAWWVVPLFFSLAGALLAFLVYRSFHTGEAAKELTNIPATTNAGVGVWLAGLSGVGAGVVCLWALVARVSDGD